MKKIEISRKYKPLLIDVVEVVPAATCCYYHSCAVSKLLSDFEETLTFYKCMLANCTRGLRSEGKLTISLLLSPSLANTKKR